MNTFETVKKSTKQTHQGEKTLFDLKRSLLVGADAFYALHKGHHVIHARQQHRLKDLISFARERSPYYRSLYAGAPQETTDLSLLPPTQKTELMENFDGWVTDPAVSRGEVEEHLADESRIGRPLVGRYLVWTSSGTSGVPISLVCDRRALSVMAVMGLVRGPAELRDLLKIGLRGSRQVGLYGAGGHLHAVVVMEHMRSNPRRAEKFAGLSVLTPMPELVRKLNDFQPAMFWAFSSTLLLLAEEQRAGRLRINPALTLSGGEVLTPEARGRMETAFGCPIGDYYGAAEAPGLSYSCRHGRLHVNADWFVLEPVDEDYRPVAPGEVSHTVLLTNLANRVQPLIRYDLGDRVSIMPDRCECGSPLPAIWVEGRRNELISFRSENGEAVRLPPRALSMVVDSVPGVYRCQVVKTDRRELKVRIEPEAGVEREKLFSKAIERMQEYLSSQGLSSVDVERDPEAPSIDPRTGKFRHVWSEVEEEAQQTTW